MLFDYTTDDDVEEGTQGKLIERFDSSNQAISPGAFERNYNFAQR